jgi:hypothetical protein
MRRLAERMDRPSYSKTLTQRLYCLPMTYRPVLRVYLLWQRLRLCKIRLVAGKAAK